MEETRAMRLLEERAREDGACRGCGWIPARCTTRTATRSRRPGAA